MNKRDLAEEITNVLCSFAECTRENKRLRKELAQLKTEKLEREENKPLTIEELRGMVGEPVWVDEEVEWGLLQFDEDVCDERFGDFYVMITNSVNSTRCKSVKFNNYTLYKHKPKGDDLHE